MTKSTQKSPMILDTTIRVVAIALFLVFGASAALAQPRLYVPNILGDSVSVIDSATNTVIATVPAGNFAAAVAVTPNGDFAM